MRALVDNDFINHLVGKELPSEQLLENVIKQMFDGLGVEAYIHELVKKHELNVQVLPEKKQKVVASLFEKKYIQVANLYDVLKTEAQRVYYRKAFVDIYHELKGELPYDEKDILIGWKGQKSLGEVHSLTMCMMTDFGIFLSDDNDSQRIMVIKDKFSITIEVYNRKKALDRINELGITKIERKTRKALVSDKNN